MSTTFFNKNNIFYKFSSSITILFLTSILMACPFSVLAKQEKTLHIENSWIRQAPPKSKVLAAYFEINNQSNKQWILKNITSNNFEKIEIHNSKNHQGMMHMEKQKNVIIPALKKVVFKPNGLHLMLINPKNALRAGDQVILSFTFDNDNILKISVPVKKRGTDLNSTHQPH